MSYLLYLSCMQPLILMYVCIKQSKERVAFLGGKGGHGEEEFNMGVDMGTHISVYTCLLRDVVSMGPLSYSVGSLRGNTSSGYSKSET